jgi:hypothetical protein
MAALGGSVATVLAYPVRSFTPRVSRTDEENIEADSRLVTMSTPGVVRQRHVADLNQENSNESNSNASLPTGSIITPGSTESTPTSPGEPSLTVVKEEVRGHSADLGTLSPNRNAFKVCMASHVNRDWIESLLGRFTS